MVLSADKVEIKIYTSTGFHIDTITPDNLSINQYNEVAWNSIKNPPGLYFASLSAYSNSNEIDTKIIKILIP